MEYEVGQKVLIKSLDWYNENKDERGEIRFENGIFTNLKSLYLGYIMTIAEITPENQYIFHEDKYQTLWTDEMIEGLAEEPTILNGKEFMLKLADIELPSGTTNIWECPEGYIFKDENGNVINATKIVLEKANTLKTQSDNMETEIHKGYCTTDVETTNESKKVAWFTFEDNDFADKVELALSNRELIQEDGKWFVVKKKKEYPKTYEECLSVLKIKGYDIVAYVPSWTAYEEALYQKVLKLRELIICRDAYWKIAGEEMGLGKPWKPDYDSGVDKFGIICLDGVVQESNPTTYWERHLNKILDFPTKEMRDAFYENFKKEIETCKELL